MRAALSLLMAHACALVVGLGFLLGMGEARAESLALWQYGSAPVGSCPGPLFEASSPEAVAREWIDFATACNGNPQETYELLWCSYQDAGNPRAGLATCLVRTHSTGFTVDNYFGIRTWCPAGLTFDGGEHDCLCPDGEVWDSALQSCLVQVSVPWAENPPSCPADPGEGNPIHPLRGVKHQVADTGLAIGRTTLQFSYDTAAKVPRTPVLPARGGGRQQRGGVLGGAQDAGLWSSNLHRRVSLGGKSQGATVPVSATVLDRGNGTSRTMVSTNGGLPTAEPQNTDRLVALAGGSYAYTDSRSNVQEVYDRAGALQSMSWPDGSRIEFSYSDASTPAEIAPRAGMLIEAADNRGHRLSLRYVDPGAGLQPRLASVTDAAGGQLALGYDAKQNLGTLTWADGRSRRFVYERGDLPWALTGVVDERSTRYASFGYDGAGRAISTEHAGGTDRYTVSYATPPAVRVTEQSVPGGVVRYEDWVLPQGVVLTGPTGSTSQLEATSLNGKNQLTGQSQEAGSGCAASALTLGYDANGNLASRDDFNGKRSCNANDLTRNLAVTQVAGLPISQACEAVTPANATLPAGAVKTSMQWHPDWSLPIKVAEPKRITTSVYNGQPDPLNGNTIASCAPATATMPDGKSTPVLCKQVTQTTTDEDGHLGFEAPLQTGAMARVSSWTYDAQGRVLSASLGSGTYQYQRAAATTADYTEGDLLRITAPSGEVTAFDRYNKYGQVLQSTGPTGTVTTYTYDLRQRMLSRTVGAVNPQTTAYEYDPVGQLTKVTLPDGSWVGYAYDDAQRLIAVTDKQGNRIDYVLDNAGNRVDQRVKDPLGELKQSLNRAMDALGREQQAGVTDPTPTSQTWPPLPVSPLPLERYEYDAQGNRTKITQGAGTLNLVTKLSYDALERVKDTTDPRNGTTRFEYDGGDRATQVTDPRNLATQYARNGFGDATQVISPDTGSENLSYDAAGNLKTRSDSRGVLTTYGYDLSDRLTSAVYTQGGQPTETVTLAYSQTGEGFSYGGGRLTSSSYPGGSARYGYDEQGELARDVQRIEATTGSNAAPINQTVAYGYTLGNLSGINYPSSRQLGLSWVDGEVTEITLGGTPLITQIEWTPFAGTVKRWGWAMASGTKSNERYFDLAGRAIRYPLGEALRDVRYDEASRIVSFTHLSADGTAQPALDQAFGYDENSRLTGITTNAASWGISYDANGNRTGLSLNGSPSTYSVEATSNRTTGITNPARSLVFDNAGNTISDSAADGSGYTATYNLRGQLATITKNGVTTSYTYNAAGQRVRKVSSTGPQSTVVFVYDQAGHLLGEYDQNGAALREYVWLRDTPMAMFTPDPVNPTGEPLVYFIHTDHLNTPRVVVDRQNRVRWRWLAEPFGTSAPETNPSGLGVFVQNLRFPGQYADQESGLFYNYFRYYNAAGGQYTQSDPIGLAAGSLTTFGYVVGDPLSRSDPSGLMDTMTARILATAARGNLEEAILIAQNAGAGAGVIALATKLQQLQSAIQTLTTRYPLATNKCVDVADGIANAAKSVNLTVQFIRIAPARTNFVYIGDKYTAFQHFAVRIGDRVFDAYTGAEGMLYSQYINMLSNSNLGPGSYLIETLKNIGPYR